MSHTQAEIKKMITRDREDLKEILDGYKFLPEYQDATDEVKRLRHELVLAERNQTEIIVDYKEGCKDDINLKREDISYLQDMLDDLRRGLDVNDYNQDLVDMFSKFYSAFTTSHMKKLHWVEEFGNFAIFKTLSHESVPVAWYLYEITEDFNSDIKYNDGHIWKTEGGHWGKKRNENAMEAIEGFLNQEFFLNLLEELGWETYKYRGCKYRLEFTAPDYDRDASYEENKDKKIYINYNKIPTTDAEAFMLYPMLRKYK